MKPLSVSDSMQGNPPPAEMWRQPGENRSAHRARLKKDRRHKPPNDQARRPDPAR